LQLSVGKDKGFTPRRKEKKNGRRSLVLLFFAPWREPSSLLHWLLSIANRNNSSFIIHRFFFARRILA
jgi:hypothetical protein